MKPQYQPIPFALLIKSFCPAIYGYEIVKAGILLTMTHGSDALYFRKKPHILLVGDPGLGKSELVRFAKSICDREVTVSGNTATIQTLTASMDHGGGYLEGGATVMADNGLLFIDEFDKMHKLH